MREKERKSEIQKGQKRRVGGKEDGRKQEKRD